VTVQDRGFATFPVPGSPATRTIVGAAAAFRNTTDQPIRVHVRFRFVDGAGRGWHSAEQNDWAAIINAGWAYLPPGKTLELGGDHQVVVKEAARVAGIVLSVTGEPAKPSVLLSARIAKITHRPSPADEWDYVSFDVDNPGARCAEASYGMVFRSAQGRLIGGWFVDRANWIDIASALPKSETDTYPEGASRHTLPAWLPPDVQPNGVTMYVWQ
jgi:hypothetical protein